MVLGRHAQHVQGRVEEGAGVAGHLRQRLPAAQHVGRGHLPVGGGVVPGAHGVVAAHEGVEELRHVPGGIDPRHLRLQELVGHHPLAHRHAGTLQKLRVQGQTQPAAHQLRLHGAAGGGHHPRDGAVLHQHPGHLFAVDDLHPVAAGDAVHQLPARLIQYAPQKPRPPDEPHHLQAPAAQALGELVGDVAAPHGDGPPGPLRLLDDGPGVVQGLEVDDTHRVRLRARHRQGIGPAPAGHQQAVVGQRLAGVGEHHPLLGHHPHGPHAQPQVVARLAVVVRRAHEHLALGDLAPQKPGQGHPVVEGVRFLGHHGDVYGRIQLPDGLGSHGAGDAVADDDHPSHLAGRVQRVRRSLPCGARPG